MTQSFIATVQRDLAARGYDVGLPDGVAGPRTEAAWRAMVATMPAAQIPTPAASTGGLKRLVLHWSAGTHNVSALDRSHYHFTVAHGNGVLRFGHAGKPANIPFTALRDAKRRLHFGMGQDRGPRVRYAVLLRQTRCEATEGVKLGRGDRICPGA